MPSPRPAPQDRRSGFALLITITLLAFLVLLLVSLASLTRVETQVAANNQQLSQARQNALMALNVALGRLQSLAGPDQRITATADIIPGVHNDKRRWTGVWNTTAASPVPEWLVSSAAATPPAGAASVTTELAPAGTVPLLGINSVDTDDDNTLGNAVVVETQPIISASVPGIPGDQTIGHFAYWVGDEGVKAKVSLRDPWSASTATNDEQAYRLRVAQRAGIERVDLATDTPLSTAYPANHADLPKVLGLKQLSLVPTGDSDRLNAATRTRFHDLTASSYSVLADVAQGGLKKDLTAWLAHPTGLPGDAPADSDFMSPLDSGDSTGFSMPRWGLVRTYAGLQGGSTPIPPQPQTDTQHGFHPLVSYFRFALGVSCPGAGQPMVAHLFPMVVLWNPHDTPIAASDYDFVFGIRYNQNNTLFQSAYTTINPVTGLPTTVTSSKGRLLFSSTARLHTGDDTLVPNGSNAARTYTRLRLVSPVIQPGQSLVFTLDSSGAYQHPGDPGWIPLSPNTPPAIDHSLRFSNPAITLTAAEMTGTMRIIISGGELDMGLYPPQPAAPNPSVLQWRDLTPYHLIQHFGLTSRTGTSAIPQDPDDALPNAHYWHRLPVTTHLNNQYYRNARWLANLSPRAPYHLTVSGATGTPTLSPTYLNDSTNNPPAPDMFDGNQVSAGYFTSPVPARPLTIAGLPSASPEARFFSLADLQHVNFSKHPSNPTYAVGNSQVHYAVGNISGLTATRAALTPNGSMFVPSSQMNRLYDLSYLLNRTLWDRYFFSTVPQTVTSTQIADRTYSLPNARLVFHRDREVDPSVASLASASAFESAAAGLVVNGGFNVNSTSEQAWRALLASHHDVDTATGGFAHPFSRFSSTRAGNPANQPRTSGYRILSDAQINHLAAKIVAEVRARGPFLSLADFVNRRLANNAAGYKGALQAAIDATDTSTNASERINDLAPFNETASQIGTQSFFPGASANEDQKKLHLASDEDSSFARTRPSGSRAAFMPGFLTQADLLNSLGPVLTARSDTFVIRTYGDVQNPVTSVVESRAWCEAVVQRLPAYVEAALDPWATPAAGSQSETFGRRFKIVSFRWLAPDDI